MKKEKDEKEVRRMRDGRNKRFICVYRLAFVPSVNIILEAIKSESFSLVSITNNVK